MTRTSSKKDSKQQGNTLVMKFGGTSVGSSQAIKQAAQIVLQERRSWQNLIVVVSAMSGVTNTLIECAGLAADGHEDKWRETYESLKCKHIDTLKSLLDETEADIMAEIETLLDDLATLLQGIQILGESTPRAIDAVTSFGERLNARIFSAFLQSQKCGSQAVDAMQLIRTDSNFQNARPNMEKTREISQKVLEPILKEGKVPVVTGFIAADEKGVITTLGRGGSDFSASILADSLDADEVWTWTDVDGVMSADPRIVSDAIVISKISYNEVAEMAYFGAKVLHPKSIRPVIEKKIPLWVKNTFNPEHPGTCVNGAKSRESGRITAITAIRDLSLITVEGRGMLGVPGIAARTFSAVAKNNASVLMISQSSSEQSICFVIPTLNEQEVVGAIEEEMALELINRDIDKVWAKSGVVIVTAIGSGMRQTPGVSARLFGALGAEDINVIAIAQGSSEYSISVVVDEKEADQAVRQIHKEVIKNGSR